MIKNVVMEFLLGRVETYIKEIILMIYVMDMVKCIGRMVLIIVGNLIRD